MPSGKAWTIRDRYGNDIYLTWERWSHIIDPDNHPEVEPYFEYIMVVCVRFRWSTQPNGVVQEEKFVTTAYFQNF